MIFNAAHKALADWFVEILETSPGSGASNFAPSEGRRQSLRRRCSKSLTSDLRLKALAAELVTEHPLTVDVGRQRSVQFEWESSVLRLHFRDFE